MLGQPGRCDLVQQNSRCVQHQRHLARPVARRLRRDLTLVARNNSSSSSTDGSSAEPSTSGRPEEDVAAAWTLLKAFSLAQFRGLSQQYVATAGARTKLRDALMLAYSNPCAAEGWNPAAQVDVLLGVVASDSRLGLRALRDWCQALGLEYVMPDSRVTGVASIASVAGAVYIKYNSVSKVCYLSQYKGHDRGVLIQLGQGPLLGHFPLGFFDEAMSNPPPVLGNNAPAGQSGSKQPQQQL